MRKDFQRIMGQTNNDFRFQILILTNSPTPAMFACWKMRFKTEVRTCSQFTSEAVLWIKEVEMVESVDDLKSSRSIKGTHGPDFALLDTMSIASALKKIIHNSHFTSKEGSVWRNKKPRKRTVSFAEDRSLT